MEKIIYSLLLCVPLAVGIFISYYRTPRDKNRRKEVLKKYHQFLEEKEQRKNKLKIPGYYEDFLSPEDDNTKDHSFYYFGNGNFWL